MQSSIVGKLGETYAAHFLQSLGYFVTASNFRIRGGEIDLVAEDPENGMLIFAEVKTRTSNSYGEGEDAFTWKKKMRFSRAIREFLLRKFLALRKQPPKIRKDLLDIRLHSDGYVTDLSHFEEV